MASAPTELHQQTALALAKLLREKEISCEDVLEAHLARVEAHDPRLAAFVRTFPDRARRRAKRWDRRGPEGQRGIFWGVPSGIKDTDPMAGSLTQFGSRAYRYLWTPFGNAITKRFQGGGFNLIGKLATSEFAIMPSTETDIHPPCRNPWHLEHSPGGSSGGSASAVAAGLLPIAHAADGGGSIRIPAAFCHLFGLKPSRGLMPNFYEPVDPSGMSTVNVVSRDVDDCAAALDMMVERSYDPRHPPADSFLAQCQELPQGLRLRFVDRSPLGPVMPFIADAVRAVASTLSELGHHVSEGEPPSIELEEFLPIWFRMVANMPALRPSILQPSTQWLRKQGQDIARDDAANAHRQLTQRVLEWVGEADILISPTVAVTPPPTGAWADMSGEDAFMAATQIGAFTAIFNVSGQPAANVPAGISPEGLPYGVQIVGQPGQDLLVLQLAKQLEAAMPWAQRRSPIMDEAAR